MAAAEAKLKKSHQSELDTLRQAHAAEASEIQRQLDATQVKLGELGREVNLLRGESGAVQLHVSIVTTLLVSVAWQFSYYFFVRNI